MDRQRQTIIAIADRAGLCALRWLARAVTVAAMWPLWYACFGESEFDWEAMMFGGPGVLVGLVAWSWSGYRLRHPTHHLEIDRDAGEVRLRRGGPVLESCAIDELGPWRYRSWRSTSTNQGVRTTTTWYAARCPGLGEQDVFVATDKRSCERQTAHVDALARPFDASGWQIDELAVDHVMTSYGVVRRDTLLWTAAALAGERRTLDRARLDEAARLLTRETVGERVVRRFDAVVARGGGLPALGLLTLATGAWAVGVVPLVVDQRGSNPEAAIVFAVVGAVLAVGWRAARRQVVAVVVAAAMGLTLALKPVLAPVGSIYMGELHSKSLTSETHFYYLLPGLALLVVAVALLWTTQLRGPGPTTGATRARLEPPRPQPPGSG